MFYFQFIPVSYFLFLVCVTVHLRNYCSFFHLFSSFSRWFSICKPIYNYENIRKSKKIYAQTHAGVQLPSRLFSTIRRDSPPAISVNDGKREKRNSSVAVSILISKVSNVLGIFPAAKYEQNKTFSLFVILYEKYEMYSVYQWVLWDQFMNNEFEVNAFDAFFTSSKFVLRITLLFSIFLGKHYHTTLA